MLSWSITFLVVGLIAGLLGLSGIAGQQRRLRGFCLLSFWFFFWSALLWGAGRRFRRKSQRFDHFINLCHECRCPNFSRAFL